MDFTTETTVITLYSGPDELGIQVIDRKVCRSYRKMMTLESEELGVFRYIGGIPVAIEEFSKIMKRWEQTDLSLIQILYKSNYCELRFKILDDKCDIIFKLPQERVNRNTINEQSSIIGLSKEIDNIKQVLSISKTEDISVFSRLSRRMTVVGTELVPRNLKTIHILNPNSNIATKDVNPNNNGSRCYNLQNILIDHKTKKYYGDGRIYKLEFDKVYNITIPNIPINYLIITDNSNIRQIIKDLDQLPNLEQVCICGFQVDKFELPNLSRVNTLIIGECTLKQPPVFSQFMNIDELCLARSDFGGSQPELSKLSKLKKIHLGGSKIVNPHLSGVEVV